MGLQRRSWGFPGSRRGKKSLQGSCPGLRSGASPPRQPDAAAEEASSRVTPLAPTRGRKEGAGRGFLAAEESFRGVQGPPHHHKTHWESLARAASPVLLNTAENCRPQTPDNRSLTGGDGWAQQAADFTHTVLHICVGEGLQNQPSRFEASALPGLQAKDPQISFAGWERAHTYLSRTVRVKLGLLLLSRGGRSVLGVPLLWPRAFL